MDASHRLVAMGSWVVAVFRRYSIRPGHSRTKADNEEPSGRRPTSFLIYSSFRTEHGKHVLQKRVFLLSAKIVKFLLYGQCTCNTGLGTLRCRSLRRLKEEALARMFRPCFTGRLYWNQRCLIYKDLIYKTSLRAVNASGGY